MTEERVVGDVPTETAAGVARRIEAGDVLAVSGARTRRTWG